MELITAIVNSTAFKNTETESNKIVNKFKWKSTFWEFSASLSNSVFGNWRRNVLWILVRTETRHCSIPHHKQYHHTNTLTKQTPKHQWKIPNYGTIVNELIIIRQWVHCGYYTIEFELIEHIQTHLTLFSSIKYSNYACSKQHWPIFKVTSQKQNWHTVLSATNHGNVSLKSQEPNQTMNDYNPWAWFALVRISFHILKVLLHLQWKKHLCWLTYCDIPLDVD